MKDICSFGYINMKRTKRDKKDIKRDKVEKSLKDKT